MAETRADPQQAFHTTLATGTSLLVIFVPSKDRLGASIDQEYWVDKILTSLAELFRGATAYPRGRGVWRDDQRGGALVREEPVIGFSYVAEDAVTAATLTTLYRVLSEMGRQTNQGEVGVVLDGKYYGITEYAQEVSTMLSQRMKSRRLLKCRSRHCSRRPQPAWSAWAGTIGRMGRTTGSPSAVSIE